MVAKDKTKINPSLADLAVPIDKLFEDPDNARAHDERNLEAIKASLARFGQQKPIVITTAGRIIAGNGTFAAARALGWTHLAAAQFDSENETAQMAYAIADNRTAELARWDVDVLEQSMRHLSDMGDEFVQAAGFTNDEMDEIFGRHAWPMHDAQAGEGGTDTYAEKLTITITEMSLRRVVGEKVRELIESEGWQDVVRITS